MAHKVKEVEAVACLKLDLPKEDVEERKSEKTEEQKTPPAQTRRRILYLNEVGK